jgi:FkbM family methyltransferase
MATMSKAAALWNTIKLASYGRSAASAAALLNIGLLSQTPRPRVRSFASRNLLRLSNNGRIPIKLGHGLARRQIELRFDDLGDYQSLYECFMGMYDFPSGEIRYVFDGGANIGLFSLIAAMKLRPDHIVGVEPDSDNFSLLSRNVEGLPVELVRCAIWDEEGYADFFRPGSNLGHLQGLREPEDAPQSKVETRRLASLIPPHWEMAQTWLKLDIEGAEYRVVPDLLAAGLRPAYISAEIHDYLRLGGAELVDQIRAAGYEVSVEGYGSSDYVCRQIFAQRSA